MANERNSLAVATTDYDENIGQAAVRSTPKLGQVALPQDNSSLSDIEVPNEEDVNGDESSFLGLTDLSNGIGGK